MLSIICTPMGHAQSAESTQPTQILEVVNRHITVGKRIPSLYLRVSSDRTAECHTVRFGNESDIVKRKKIPRQEYERLKAILEDQNLLQVKHRSELMHTVLDSWMEWNITIKRGSGDQEFEVSAFSPAAARAGGQPYPDVLTKLGCSVWNIRREVYGDDADAANPNDTQECRHAIETP